jgi:hypothetical protein
VSEVLAPLVGIAAGLMLVAGVAKLRSPASALEALDALGLPASTALARGVGVIEACLGAVCLIAPGHIGLAALAGAYLVLAVAVSAGRLHGERQAPCGCFGEASTPAQLGHLALNLTCATLAAAAALEPPQSLARILGEGLPALALLAGIGCSVYLTLALLTLLPESWRAYNAGRGDETA